MSLARRLAPALALLALAALTGGRPAHAQLTFDLVGPPATIDPAAASPTVFYGTITNDTGVDLNASDLAFSFDGYDPSLVNVTQDLGSPDFLIPDGTTSLPVDLFSVSLKPSTPLGLPLSLGASLQDVNGNQTPDTPVAFTAQPAGAPAVPEPAPLWLLAPGLALLGLAARRRAARA